MLGQEVEDLGGNSGLVERSGDPEEACDEKQQRPVHRRNHRAAGNFAAGEQQSGDNQRAGLARQRRREQHKQQQHGDGPLDRLVAVERVNRYRRCRREHRLTDARAPL